MKKSLESPTADQQLSALAAPGLPVRSRWLVSALVFVTLCVAQALVWEPAHDEGVTWTQAFGGLELARCDASASVAELHARLDGGAGHRAGDVLDALVRDGMHPPAYYLLVHSWASWVGTGRLALSIPAIILGVLSLLAMGRLARELAPGTDCDSWAMLLLACSPWFVGYSIFARPYGLVLFASLWSTVALLEMGRGDGAGQGRTLRWRVLFVAASGLGLYSLYHYAFVLAWQTLSLGVMALQRGEGRGREFVLLSAMAVALVCLYAPWFGSLAAHLDVAGASPYYFAGWVPLAQWPDKWGHLLLVLGLGEGLWSTSAAALRTAAWVIGLATLPLVLRSLSPTKLRSLHPAARILWISAPLVPLGILASDWLRESHTLFISKTTFVFLPMGILLALRGWQLLPRRWMANVGLSACLLLGLAAELSAIRTRGQAFTSFEVVAEYLSRTDLATHHVVLSSNRRGYTVPFLLTLREAGVRNLRVTLAEGQELQACADSLLADEGSRRLTLVDFAVPYEEQDGWSRAALARVEERASALGWSGIRLSAGDPRVGVRATSDRFWQRYSEAPGDPKVLVIAISTKTKYFSE